MQISQKGLALIKSCEGLRLSVYKDAVGLATIGYGHLLKKGEKYSTIDIPNAERLLREDVKSAEEIVNKAVQVTLSQNQFDALVCFIFNIGNGSFIKSTLLKLLNQKNYEKAACEFLKWNKAGGKVLVGLTKRRTQEMQLFLS